MGRMPQVGDEFGRYRIERQLGVGGMGVVHLATDTKMQRRVALKLVSGRLAADADFLARFHREAEILTGMDSPHIVTVFDHGDVDGVPYLAMQYVAGGDLGTLLRQGALPVTTAAEICAQVASALDDAHRAGVVHRDVKPANVLLRDGGGQEPFAYLGDFGIARSDSQESMTQTGDVAGSWEYLSPERTRGQQAGPASDVYSLGCLFYACVTGHAPYAGSDVEVAIAHSNQPVPQLPGSDDVIRRINRVLARSLAKEPSARYATAGEFRQDLLALARGGELASGPRGTSFRRAGLPRAGDPAPDRRRGRRTAWLALVALLALVVAGGAVWLGVRDDSGGSEAAGASGEQAGSGLPVIEDPVVGDWDNDGRGDVRLTRVWADGAEIKPLPQQLWTANEDGSAFEGPVEDMGQRGRDVWSGDVDGDGRLDLVEVKESDSEKSVRVRTWVGTDDGPGEPRTQRFSVNTEIFNETGYGLGDFNGDGKADLLVPAQRQENYLVLAVALSNGDGFETPVEFSWRGSGRDNTGDKFVIGDFDGDGVDDLIAMRERKSKGIRVRPFRSTGEAFVKQTPTDIDSGLYNLWLSSYTAADVDGDGADELVAMTHMPMEGEDFGVGLAVLKWSQGSFVSPRTWGEPATALDGYVKSSIVASDVDGDGLVDIVSLDGPDEEKGAYDLVWHRSTGEGFEPPVVLASPECTRDECSEGGTLLRDIS